MLKMSRIIAFILSIIMFFAGLFAPPAVKDTEWELTAWSVSSVDPADYPMTLAFEKDSFSGRSAVNLYGGNYSVIGDKIVLTGIYTTDMAGTPEMMQAEHVYFDLLGQVKKYTLTASMLTLLDENGNELLIFEKTV
jgi:heat shock protein HslJ